MTSQPTTGPTCTRCGEAITHAMTPYGMRWIAAHIPVDKPGRYECAGQGKELGDRHTPVAGSPE